MRRPRVSDASEAELVVRAPVLARIEPVDPTPERTRRRADREVSPLIDLATDRYDALYTRLADMLGDLPRLAVIGDEAATVATVAANLAAAAAHAARQTIVVDADLDAHTLSGVLPVRAAPGLADVLARRLAWSDAIVPALVGRDRTVDVLPAGVARAGTPLSGAAEALREEIDHLARRYDTVIVSAPSSRRGSVAAAAAAAAQAIICVRVSRTLIRTLHRILIETRDAGAIIRGVVLWSVDDAVPRAAAESAAPPRAAPRVSVPPVTREPARETERETVPATRETTPVTRETTPITRDADG
jgi:MinD-like ATPase involved in chromosome partitioning or flagellar assembly